MSDLNNNINSAINANASKNKKKKNKKKAKKQNTLDSSNTTSGLSTPNLADMENIDPSPLSGEASATAQSLPAAPIEDASATSASSEPIITETQTTAADTPALSGEASVLASSLPAKPIVESEASAEPVDGSIHDKNIPAAGPVGPGALGATAAGVSAVATTAATTAAVGSSASNPLPDPFPVSDNVQYAIKSVIAARSINLDSIVNKIRSNVTAGDYKEKAKPPPSTAAATTTATTTATTADKQAPVPTTVNTDAAINPVAAVGTPNSAPAGIAANSNTESSLTKPVKKAVAGVGAAVAGAAAAVGASKASHNTDNKAAAAAPPTPQTTQLASTTSEVTKLSESIQHCIQSAVQAPSIDVYGILDPTQKVKRPEAAVGSTTQPAMPSSAKAPDVPKKAAKSPEHRHKPSFLKKKNCIIL